MASLKFYLDKRSRKTDGTYPLKITVSHKQKPFLVSLDVSIPPENWIGNKIEGNIKNKKFLNDYIQARYAGIENLILKLHLQGTLESTSSEELKRLINALVEPDTYSDQPEEKIKGENYLFRTHAEKFISTREGRGTKEVYDYTIEMLNKKFDLNTLTFGMINYEWVERLDSDLRKTLKVNSVSIHLRNIRAIFKNATKKKLDPATCTRLRIILSATRKQHTEQLLLKIFALCGIMRWNPIRYRTGICFCCSFT